MSGELNGSVIENIVFDVGQFSIDELRDLRWALNRVLSQEGCPQVGQRFLRALVHVLETELALRSAYPAPG